MFPRKTSASPNDDLAFFGPPDLFVPDDISEIHVSVTWTSDMQYGEWLAEQWKHIAPVKIGGPAYDDRGSDFVAGRYIKHGYTITSRGCPNNCWFCFVPKREGGIRELPIVDGYNVLDSNLLACSDGHIKAVFDMLGRQKNRPEFTGGLEAARLKRWHVEELKKIKPKQMFFAYDTPDDRDPLFVAGALLGSFGFDQNNCRCYVLIGHPKDTIEDAEKRLLDTWKAGFMPFAMLWRGKNGDECKSREWTKLARAYSRPAITRPLIMERLGMR